MSRLLFSYFTESELHWAYFASGVERPIRKNWPGLFVEGSFEKDEVSPWLRLGINNNNCEEVAVYLRVAWSLLQRRAEVLGCALFWGEEAADDLGQVGRIVRWQFEADSDGPPGQLEIIGFTPARSSVQIDPPPTDAQRKMEDRTRLFQLSKFSDLKLLLHSAFCFDAAGQVSLYGTSQAGRERIAGCLSSPEQPSMSELLQADDVFVAVGIGVDRGYNDFIIVASRQALEPVLEPLRAEVEEAIAVYERGINESVSPADALRMMETLAGIKPYLHS